MSRKLNEFTIGDQFGQITIISEVFPRDSQHRKVLYKCKCGNEKTANLHDVLKEKIRSCGCLKSIIVNGYQTKKHPLYQTYRGILDRCTNPKSKYWRLYGERGIKICDRWINSFQYFVDDMGEKPSAKHSIDRIDVNGNYEPSNCRWATQIEQGNNKRNTIRLLVDGQMMTINEIASYTGISRNTLYSRLIEYKWGIEISIQKKKFTRIKH